MSVDISELSSDQLFELAQKKRQQEAQRTEAREAAIRQLKQQRVQLAAEHAKALEAVDYQIRDLHNKRAQLVIRHKSAIDVVDKQLAELHLEAKNEKTGADGQHRTETASLESSIVITATTPPAAGGRSAPSTEVLYEIAVELMRGRTYFSESLLKEKLRSKGLDVSQLGKQIEQMARSGALVNRGSGNYALGKKK